MKIVLHEKSFHDLYKSHSVVRVVETGMFQLFGHVTRMGTQEVHTEFWRRNILNTIHLEDGGN
jgi:hypothetical protein